MGWEAKILKNAQESASLPDRGSELAERVGFGPIRVLNCSSMIRRRRSPASTPRSTVEQRDRDVATSPLLTSTIDVCSRNGGRRRWARPRFTRINIERSFPLNRIEEILELSRSARVLLTEIAFCGVRAASQKSLEISRNLVVIHQWWAQWWGARPESAQHESRRSDALDPRGHLFGIRWEVASATRASLRSCMRSSASGSTR